MNVPAKTEGFDPDTGEIKESAAGLPAVVGMQNQSLAVQLAMAELNQDIITARGFPRSISRVMRNINELVMLDEATAKECVYAVPRDGKTIRGPSIRLAEIIASQWGNCHCASRVVHVDRIEKYVESEGVFHDLETGLKRTARTRKPIAKRDGGIYSLDMINTAGNAAASIAMRESILKGVPKAVWRQAFEYAEKVISGDASTLAERRADAMKALAGIGVVAERVFGALGVAGIEEIGLDELADLFAMYTGVKNGDTNVDDVFPPVKPKGDRPADLKGRLDKLAESKDQPSTAGDDKPADQATTAEGDGTPAGKPAEEQQPKPKKSTKSEAGSPPVAGSDASGKQASAADATATGPQPSSGATATQAQQPDDGAVSPVEQAARMGRAAARKGLSRNRTIPANFKAEGREAEMQAYLDAYDDEAKGDDEDDGPEPGSIEED